jgi:thiosulfate reductase cytochrome b subunit
MIQELALLVMVHKNASLITWLLLPAGLLLLLLLAGGYYGQRRFRGKKRKSRRITRD